MRGQSAKHIFQQARELPPDERERYLQTACGDDAELRARVESLLRAELKASGLVAGLDASPLLRAGADDPYERPGTEIGPYKLLTLLGEGGFGSVWMAEQREPVRRRVALKIIKLGMDTRQVIHRFEAERQALAMMEHANIARILDAGATGTGRPYFVMELVKGVSITQYCDSERLSTRERLELFRTVCQAIQHAHQKGIIHRDIKPGNVLVTLNDSAPVVKVIDFGIAKATNQELTNKTLFTEHKQVIGTPAYMSPEQAEMSGLDIDTRSDIYSLGVLLYELLTGTTPFDTTQLVEAGLAEMMRVIREEEPHKPSTRWAALGETAKELALLRHSADPQKIGTALRHDLDWIVMKCLDKDRRRRYDTAAGLAGDVDSFLAGEPVLAAPPSVGYRLRKFVRRNRGPVIAGTALLLVFLLGLVGTTGGLLWALKQRDRAVLAEQSMQRELARVREVKRLVTEMIAGVSPSEARDADKTLLKGILDRTAQRLTNGEIEDQLIAAELHDVIGDTYVQLGLFEEADRHLPPAVAIRAELLGEGSEETLHSCMRLAILRRQQGRLDEAQALYEDALARARQSLGGDHWLTLGLTNNVGTLYWQQDRLEDAQAMYALAREGYARTLGSEDPKTLMASGNLAMLLRKLERFEEAEELARETLAIQQRVLGPDDPNTIGTLNSLGTLYTSQQQYAEAATAFEQVLRRSRRVLGNEHPRTATVTGNLAWVYGRIDRLDDAEALYLETIEIRRDALGAEHVDTLRARTALAEFYLGRGRFEEALTQLEICTPELLLQLGDEHHEADRAVACLSRVYRELGRDDDGLALERELLERRLDRARQSGADARQVHRAASMLVATGYAELRDPLLALELARSASAMAEAADDPGLPGYLDTLARAQHQSGDTVGALATQQRAVELSAGDDAALVDRLAVYEVALANGQ